MFFGNPLKVEEFHISLEKIIENIKECKENST